VPLYTPEIVERYKQAGAGSAAAALPPHVFLTADAAYKAMCASRRSQSLVISGESGSGKTETTKIAMQARAAARRRPARAQPRQNAGW
jgi:myosin-5